MTQLKPVDQKSSTWQRTTLLATDNSQSIIGEIVDGKHNSIAYSAYGEQFAKQEDKIRLGFNGQLREAKVGWYLLGNGYRAYNPVLMRFHSPDSMSPFDSGGVNPYAYCVGDPVNMTDPTGHFSWRTFLGIAISIAAIAFTIATLGSSGPLTGPLIVAAALNIGAEVLSIAGEVTSLLAPTSKAGSILGYIGLGLAAVSVSAPYAARLAGSGTARAVGKFFKATPSAAFQAIGQPIGVQGVKSAGSLAKLGRGAKRTAAALELLDAGIPKYFGYVKWAGRAVKAASYVEENGIPYLYSPSTGQSDGSPSTLDAFVRGDADQGAQGLGQINIKPGDFLTADEDRMQAIREF